MKIGYDCPWFFHTESLCSFMAPKRFFHTNRKVVKCQNGLYGFRSNIFIFIYHRVLFLMNLEVFHIFAGPKQSTNQLKSIKKTIGSSQIARTFRKLYTASRTIISVRWWFYVATIIFNWITHTHTTKKIEKNRYQITTRNATKKISFRFRIGVGLMSGQKETKTRTKRETGHRGEFNMFLKAAFRIKSNGKLNTDESVRFITLKTKYKMHAKRYYTSDCLRFFGFPSISSRLCWRRGIITAAGRNPEMYLFYRFVPRKEKMK